MVGRAGTPGIPGTARPLAMAALYGALERPGSGQWGHNGPFSQLSGPEQASVNTS